MMKCFITKIEEKEDCLEVVLHIGFPRNHALYPEALMKWQLEDNNRIADYNNDLRKWQSDYENYLDRYNQYNSLRVGPCELLQNPFKKLNVPDIEEVPFVEAVVNEKEE